MSLEAPHASTAEQVLGELAVDAKGLSSEQAALRRQAYGLNELPRARPPGVLRVFAHQFTSPLIYVLFAAALVSLLIREWSDAGFIAAVLLVNAIIGTLQEFSAQRAAEALQQLVTTRTRVLRDGDASELDARELVPGDIVLLESGERVPADLRLLSGHDLQADESLLTGESLAVFKQAQQVLPQASVLGDRVNMAFAGTLVNRGRGAGVVVATGLHSELGRIAQAVQGGRVVKAPLLVRMQRFTHRVAIFVGIVAVLMGAVALHQGMALDEVFLLAVALAVSAIPEGLPVALTVALSIGMQRMARRHVIVRRLVAVEALGSCTFIATDKTGTLTRNQLTATRVALPGSEEWEISGEGLEPRGAIITPHGAPAADQQGMFERLCRCAVLANEGFLGRRDGAWTQHGDAVDVALLVLAHKGGVVRGELLVQLPELGSIPFESERRYSASLNGAAAGALVSVKGALESVLPMCNRMLTSEGEAALDEQMVEQQAHRLATRGFRVIALADGSGGSGTPLSETQLDDLCLLGLIGLIDPLRPEASEAVEACRSAGIQVAMVTGDHPDTAYAIGAELGLASDPAQVITGPQLQRAESEAEQDRLVHGARVFARMEPRQKTDIVRSLQRQGEFVAVTGDGANDAPALRAAQVGVAMGRSGTDVARETAELVITDDNFASIVSGVEEGRIAYANVRKVIFLLISTGAAELVLFTLALLTGLPLPLLAVQLLWLNLVTNGIQDVALAFEPGEGNELRRPPRAPSESVFNRLMIERVLISALTIGVVAFLLFKALLDAGMSVDAARNSTLLLIVLFENVHVFNSRSETCSAFAHSPLRNPLLLIGTLVAQLVHIGAMYTPWISDVLHIQPVSLGHWGELLLMAVSVLLVMELHKLWRRRRDAS